MSVPYNMLMDTGGRGNGADRVSSCGRAPGDLPESLARRVAEVHAACRERYPAVDLPFEVFSQRIREVLGPADEEGEPGGGRRDRRPADFERLAHGDLYLALACSRGDRIAWEYFADEYLPVLRSLAARACGDVGEGEDLAQELTAGMLVESAAGPDERGCARHGRLATYGGRGSLLGWLRVVVAHAAVDRMRQRRREMPIDESAGAGRHARDAREQLRKTANEASVDERWGPSLAAVLAEEIRRLPAGDRLLLALYYVQEAPLGSIGRLFGVHEATVSRRLARLRKTIRKNVERECRRRHGLGPRDVVQLWQWVARRVELPLAEILGARAADRKADAKKPQDPAGGSS